MSDERVTVKQPTSKDLNEQDNLNRPTWAPGLGCLKDVDTLLIKERTDYRDGFSDHDHKDTYIVTDKGGVKLFTVKEESDCCSRNYWGFCRGFNLELKTIVGFPALTLERPVRCHRCCFPCCLQEINAFDANGEYVGTVEQKWSLLFLHYVVKNAKGQIVLHVKEQSGGSCPAFRQVLHKVQLEDGQTVGSIVKPWRGFFEEMFSQPYNFKIHFPAEMGPNTKALLLGAYFLIRYRYREVC